MFQVMRDGDELWSKHDNLAGALRSIGEVDPSVNSVLRFEIWDTMRPNHVRLVAVVDTEGAQVDLPVPLWYKG